MKKVKKGDVVRLPCRDSFERDFEYIGKGRYRCIECGRIRRRRPAY